MRFLFQLQALTFQTRSRDYDRGRMFVTADFCDDSGNLQGLAYRALKILVCLFGRAQAKPGNVYPNFLDPLETTSEDFTLRP